MVDNYKSAEELGIEQWEREGLILTIGKLESIKTNKEDSEQEQFDIRQTAEGPQRRWKYTEDGKNVPYECGTIACIGGWAYLLTGGEPNSNSNSDYDTYDKSLYELADEYVGDEYSISLHKLYYPDIGEWDRVTAQVAINATKYFLETGQVDWERAIENS